MYKVNIQNNQDSSRKWEAFFDSLQDASDWADQQKLKEGRSEQEATYSTTNLNEDYNYLLEKCYENRRRAYPSMADYLDGIVKGDSQQVQAYIDACLAVKQQYPKPE